MENKEIMMNDQLVNAGAIAIPIGIDETLYVDARHADVLHGLVQHQLLSELNIDAKTAEGAKMIGVVTDALSRMLHDNDALAFNVDQFAHQTTQIELH